MCTFGFKGCCVKPSSFGAAGLRTTTRELLTSTFDGPGTSKQTPPKNHENTPRETKRAKMGAGDEKSAKYWAPHPSAPPFGAPPSGPISSGSHFFLGLAPPLGPHHDTHQIQNLIGQNWIGQNWIGQYWVWPRMDWPKSVSSHTPHHTHTHTPHNTPTPTTPHTHATHAHHTQHTQHTQQRNTTYKTLPSRKVVQGSPNQQQPQQQTQNKWGVGPRRVGPLS